MKTCRICQRSYSNNFANCPQDGAPLFESEDWAEGTVVRGKYKIMQKVGQGAMGAVYKALHMHFQEMRALKVISAKLSSDKTFVKRFEQEAILARRLQHPNAVRVDDIDETEDGQPFIVMEYIEGRSLRKVIAAEGPMAPRRASSIIRQVASALDAAHRLRIVHRDIKPENIVLIHSQTQDLAKVLDFGIAKLKEGISGTTATSVTDTGMVVGTPPYMSPEQAMASPGNELDGRSDIYSLGVVMYQMLTDDLPIKGDTPLQIVLGHIQTPPIPIEETRAGARVPRPLADLVMRCLEKDPNDRPLDGQSIIVELEKWELENPEKKEERKTRIVPVDRTLRSTQVIPQTAQFPGVSAAVKSAGTANNAESDAAQIPSQQVPSRSWGSWAPLAALVLVVGLGTAAAWRYRGALLSLVERRTNTAASAGAPQPKTETPSPAQPADALPGPTTDKPFAPDSNAAKVSAVSDNAPPSDVAEKPLPPPDPSKTRIYTDAGGRKVSFASSPTAEHNAFKAVQAEKNEAQQIQRLDDFVAKFPNSDLLADAYALYYRDYRELNNFPKVIEYSDKLVALGGKADANARFQALYARAIAYDSLRSNDPAQAKAAKDAAILALSTLNEIKKPDNVSEAAFAAQRKPLMLYFDVTAGSASMVLKDFPGAIESYRAALALDPEDANANYQLGLAYWQVSPPRQQDAFWALGRAATAKNKGEPQPQQIKAYLRKLMAGYEQTECLSLVETQLNEWLQAAGSSLDRPENFKLPSKADLDSARSNMSITTVMADLKAGGDKAKITWLAACGMQFNGVGKVISVAQGDPVVLKVALVTTELEFHSARRANMDVSVVGQPEAGDIPVGKLVRFTGSLSDYDRSPLMLRWQKAKINLQDIPSAGK